MLYVMFFCAWFICSFFEISFFNFAPKYRIFNLYILSTSEASLIVSRLIDRLFFVLRLIGSISVISRCFKTKEVNFLYTEHSN